VLIDNRTTSAACAISGQTGQQITLTGNNLNSGASVKISPGGGTVYATAQPTAGTITFCLTTAANPGNYTITVINPDFGLYKQQLAEEPYVTSVGGYNAASHTVVLTGDGFESDATVTCTGGGASCGSQAPISATSITIPSYVGPSNGASTSLTVTNPDDGTTTTTTVTAPNITAGPVVIKGTTETGQVFNGTGFESGLTIAPTGGSPLPTMSAVTYGSSTSASATITTASTFSGSSFPVILTNPDGGTDTGTVTVDAPPTIAISKTTITSPKKSTSLTVTTTGTGISTSDTASSFSTSWKLGGATTVKAVTLVSGLSATGATLTTTAPSTAGTYTLTVTVTNPDAGTATSATFSVVVTN
jgi:hypothetical protein